ncbi:tRNA-modifying protein YgfZ [Flocculibacter collagenilyticus]|uniref:tRNA-modifying protein YgfZ n=1 Tax=Flocculibacter collagenilyticus TaxID=2744479 RepID=UPI0018F2BD2A|nr:tRNA-modifying protein YgfZ [Flocculibacter collagenilyticus]
MSTSQPTTHCLTTQSITQDNLTQAQQLAIMPLNDYGIISLIGEDNKSYLQGQVTCDLTELTEQNAIRGAHCDAKGKMWSTFHLFQRNEEVLLLSHQDEHASTLPELKKFGVFSKSTIENATAHFAIFGISGTDAGNWLKQTTQIDLSAQNSATNNESNITAIKLSEERFILLLAQAEAEEFMTEHQSFLYSPEYWQYLSIMDGEPHLTAPLINEYVPQALNQQALNAISFTKGCYIGQEMVARMKFLGKNKRATYILKGSSDILPVSGDSIEYQLGENWRRAGVIVNAVSFLDNLYLLAVLPNDVEVSTVFRLKEQPETQLSLIPLPYSLAE